MYSSPPEAVGISCLRSRGFSVDAPCVNVSSLSPTDSAACADRRLVTGARHVASAVIGVVAAVSAVLVVYAINIDTTPPHFDSALNVLRTMKLHRSLASGRVGDMFAYDYYPRGVPAVGAVAMMLGGESYRTTLVANLTWLFALAVSLDVLGRRLRLGTAGRIALFCVPFGAPIVMGAFREYIFDLPMLVTLVAFVATLRSVPDRAHRTAWVRVATVAVVAMFVKWPAITWIAGFLMAELIWRKTARLRVFTPNGDGKATRRTWAAFALAALTCIPWYLLNLSELVADIRGNGLGAGLSEGDPQGIGWSSLWFYIKTYSINYAWVPTLCLIAALAAVVVMHRLSGQAIQSSTYQRDPRRTWVTLMVCVCTGLNLLNLLQQSNKDVRYLMPMLIPLAIAVGAGVDRLGRAGSFFSVGFVSTTILTLVSITSPLSIDSMSVTPLLPVVMASGYTATRPTEKPWIHESVVEAVEARQRLLGCDRRVKIIDPTKRLRLNQPTLEMFLAADGWTRVETGACVGIVIVDSSTTRARVERALKMPHDWIEFIDDPDTQARVWIASGHNKD